LTPAGLEGMGDPTGGTPRRLPSPPEEEFALRKNRILDFFVNSSLRKASVWRGNQRAESTSPS